MVTTVSAGSPVVQPARGATIMMSPNTTTSYHQHALGGQPDVADGKTTLRSVTGRSGPDALRHGDCIGGAMTVTVAPAVG